MHNTGELLWVFNFVRCFCSFSGVSDAKKHQESKEVEQDDNVSEEDEEEEEMEEEFEIEKN